jgi:hypothetical protein
MHLLQKLSTMSAKARPSAPLCKVSGPLSLAATALPFPGVNQEKSFYSVLSLLSATSAYNTGVKLEDSAALIWEKGGESLLHIIPVMKALCRATASCCFTAGSFVARACTSIVNLMQ